MSTEYYPLKSVFSKLEIVTDKEYSDQVTIIAKTERGEPAVTVTTTKPYQTYVLEMFFDLENTICTTNGYSGGVAVRMRDSKYNFSSLPSDKVLLSEYRRVTTVGELSEKARYHT